MKTQTFLLLLLALVPACRSSAPTDSAPPPPEERTTALEAAHVEYLQGDFLAMTKRIRDVLADPKSDALVRENALELLEKGYESQAGVLPTDWKLPAGFEGMSYKQIRVANPEDGHFSFLLSGRMDDPKRVDGLELRRWPDEVLLDKRAGIGKWASMRDDDGLHYFALEIEDRDALPAPGLFTMRLSLVDGTVVNGWFIVDRLTSSETPTMIAPVLHGSATGPNPALRWQPFRSPEYAPFEKRVLSLWVSTREADGNHKDVWSIWQSNPGERTEAIIGKKGEGGAEVALRPGDYWASITFAELRKLGPLHLMRMSRRNHPFHVVP
jgi:hypothetical protein